ncbi:AcrR family transcriptional regulator [Kibdelosporangium banguiense]|uniref:AcrR family transcriptional regulator n=1 Tax=Kibdelosporangium banguiense TaxID=1365924 RepID=A0ABS4TPH8_9PSEU|nr:TetR family transcriptional regulator [Kibdelosporangium banguiense]MBP2326307.1 AcrR family transcriptional regulator [Kibdelosporangium banguiense]
MPEDERPLGLRERKKLETRQTLSKAAVRLAAERGIENVTVDDIAAEAGVSARTFFNYFPSKEDAVLQPDPDPVEQTKIITQALASAPAEFSPVRALAFAWRPVAQRLDREAEDWLVRISIIERDPALMIKMFTAKEETERLMLEAIAARTGLDVDGDLYPRLLLMTVGAAFQAVTKRWYELGGKASVTELFDEAIDAVASGLPLPAGVSTEGMK